MPLHGCSGMGPVVIRVDTMVFTAAAACANEVSIVNNNIKVSLTFIW